jgi:catechol 2,3-dioxygenase-like lactoylglutathione lyase family enzyme
MATRKAASKKVTMTGAKGAKSVRGAKVAKSGKVAKGAKSTKVAKSSKPRVAPDVPSLFRLNVEVGDLDQAVAFYGELLGLEGRKQAGSRCYFTCGPVTLQVVDVSSAGKPHPAAKALYFTVEDLDAIWARAKALGCLSRDDVHGVSGGAISVRPWGERSFYAEDSWQNPLCFVEAGTIYPG